MTIIGTQPRRRFIQTIGAFTAASYGRVLGANDRVRVANIGCGRRRLLKDLLDVKDSAQLQVTAVCDTWRQKLDKARAEVKEMTGAEPYATKSLDDVLSRKDVDAVVIGTPDHLHCRMLIQAIKAGKDVYVEKPLAMNMKELVEAYDAVKKSDRVVQIGTQMRSYPQSNGLKTFLAEGQLGTLLKVEQVRNGYKPYWIGYGGSGFANEAPTEQDVDWKAFLGGNRNKPFNAKEYQNWYGYREFSLGSQTNLMAHFIDLLHFTTGASFPKYVVALGGTFRWKESYDVADSIEVAFEYPEGFLARYATMFGNGAGNYAKWFGTRGTVDARNLHPRERWTASGEGSGEPDKLTATVQIPEPATVHHMQNFIESVRTRKPPIAPIEAGYAHSVATLMADQALVSGRRTIYDHKRREILLG